MLSRPFASECGLLFAVSALRRVGRRLLDQVGLDAHVATRIRRLGSGDSDRATRIRRLGTQQHLAYEKPSANLRGQVRPDPRPGIVAPQVPRRACTPPLVRFVIHPHPYNPPPPSLSPSLSLSLALLLSLCSRPQNVP